MAMATVAVAWLRIPKQGFYTRYTVLRSLHCITVCAQTLSLIFPCKDFVRPSDGSYGGKVS
jgi:hypothetical protein